MLLLLELGRGVEEIDGESLKTTTKRTRGQRPGQIGHHWRRTILQVGELDDDEVLFGF